VASSIVSRKSSSRSLGSNRSKGTNRSYTTNRSNITITSTGSYIKKNSGNFDGGNSRSRRKQSSSSSAALQRKSSASSRREQIIAEFYRDLEELEEMTDSSSDSSDNDDQVEGSRRTGGGSKTKKLKKGKIQVEEELKSHQRVEEYLMRLEEPDPNNFDEDEGIRSDMSEGRHDSSCNSNYSMDYPIPTTENNSQRERKFVKRPNPPENIIKDLDSSPVTHRQKIRTERAKENSRRHVYDENKNSIKKNIREKQSTKSAYTPRTLPLHPKGVTLIDKSLHDNLNRGNVGKPEYSRVSNKEDSYTMMMDTASESSCSTDSAHGSTRSLSTVSSVSIVNHKPIHRIHHRVAVPKNFIPGHIRPGDLAEVNRYKRSGGNSLVQNYMNGKPRKVSFCFRGIPFRVFNDTPRTYRALAHAGCIALIIPAPESHKCKT